MSLLLLASTIGVATACCNTADGAKEDTKNAAEATSDAAASAGARWTPRPITRQSARM